MFIIIIKLSNKLDFAKLELFKVLKVLELITYKLDLPDSIRITRICYISVLKLADSETPFIKDIPNINSKSQKKIEEITRILNINLINNGQLKYLIK